MNGRRLAKRTEGRPTVQHVTDDPVALATQPGSRVPEADHYQRPQILEQTSSRGVGAVSRRSSVDSLDRSVSAYLSSGTIGRRSADPSIGNLGLMFTVKELAIQWKRSTRTIYRYIASGELRAHRIRRSILIAENDAKAFLAIRRI